jgi:hypothetical protein
MRRTFFCLALVAATPLLACSDDSDEDKGVNDCSTFEDRTATTSSRTMPWSLPLASAADRCMQIKVGQTVTFSGDFTSHPIRASGGDSPNPISNIPKTTGEVTFDDTGVYGFQCELHPEMRGAIKVVE